ncbi:PREDICTED: collagen alpha-1(XII) chain, partial [Galeopterus variegatus]|uniref:Collagen alpha-1(XII) chain n=1 Tax=Galeopterus variegatus TaxID=482537 RepID=A0ABM0QVW6_GALVR
MRTRLPPALAALGAALLLSSIEAEVDPPSDLNFKIIDENTVHMSWARPVDPIVGYRITVDPTTDGPTKEFTLAASTTETLLSDLIPEVEYVVTITSYDEVEESVPVIGQLTIQTGGPTKPGEKKPGKTEIQKCSVSAWTDLVFLVDGSWSVGRNNFKYILDFIAALVSAFDIGEEKTRVGVIQYSSDTRTEFNLNQYYQRDELLAAIKKIPYKGGNTMTGDAIDYLVKNTFTESAGARVGFPKVAIIITDGKSQDEVEIPARELRNVGVEVFSLGIKAADAKELKLIASTPSLNHVFNVANFDAIVDIQNEIISQVCSGVDEQLGELVSGEEVVEPPSNLIATEISSKYIKLSWSPSPSPVTGYKVLLTPMTIGSRHHALSVGPQTTTLSIRDLSADTEYQISVSAMKGVTSSEPVSIMEKTQPMKVQVECSRGVDIKADIVFLVDGSYSIGIANFVKVRAFLEVLVKSFDISPNRVQISLVQYSRDPHTEFSLKKFTKVEDILEAINTFPYRGGSTNTGKAMTYVREKIFVPGKGSRSNVPKVMILITDGKSSDAFRDPAIKLRNSDVEIFAVGVKDAVRSELEAIASPPAETHVFTVEDFDAFQRISFELTQSICLRIEQELAAIKKKAYVPPRNLSFSEVTSYSFKANWSPAGENVFSYHITYKEAAGDEEVTVVEPASSTSVVLSSLKPETLYLVNVTAEYEDGFSIPLAGEEATEEVRGNPRDLRVSDPTTSTMKLSWSGAPGKVKQYLVTYTPVAGGETQEITVSGDTTNIVLRGLKEGTQYALSVSALYASGAGDALLGEGTTLEERGSPRDLVTKDITDTSIGAYWTSAPGMVRGYRVSWKSLYDDIEAGEKNLPGDAIYTMIENLQPETKYKISVFAAYSSGEGEPVTGEATTELSQDSKILKVDEETESTMRVTWKPAPGKVVNYRVVYRPRGGGRQMVAKVPPTVTSTVLKRLQPQTTYNITVLPIYKTGEGKLRQGSGTTASRFKSPRNLKTSDPTMSSFRVTWEPAPGEVKGYKVTFHPTEDDGRLGELVVGPYDNTVVLEELRAGTTYKVNVFGMFDGGESSPLVGQEMTTLSDTTVMPILSSGMECLTRAEADIVLLVDGSWSIGRANFRTVRSFISRIVEVFEIGPKRVQIALAQYSGDPRTEWQLNAHRDKKSLLQAVANLPYKGGNTLTGMALNFIRQQSFKTQAGMRPRARKIGVLITDGKSQDDVEAPSKKLKDEGVELFAVGIKNADEVELKMIATDPDDIHAYNVADFESLSRIVDDLTTNLCNSVKGPGDLEAPSNLVISERTHRSFRVRWTPPSDSVDRYKVEYYPVSGGKRQEFYVSRLETSTVLKDLMPETEYVVNVYSVVEDEYSEPLKGTEKTLPVPVVSLNIYDVGPTAMHVQWQPVGGATGYNLSYEPVKGTESTKPKEMRVGPTVNDMQLTDLLPNTEYAITVQAALHDLTSEPVTAREFTLPLPRPEDLKLRDVTHSTMNVFWEPVPGKVRKYIVRYKTPEEDVKEVEVDRSRASTSLRDLSSQTLYTVSVSAVYDEGESPPVSAQETTRPVPAPTNLRITEVTPESFRGTWDHGASDVSLYRITWAPFGSSDKMETILNGDENTLAFENLNPNTLYEVSVTAIYPDESESDDLTGSERTLRLIPLTTQAPKSGPRNLQVYNATSNSLTVKWDPASGRVQKYRITYQPSAGEGNEQMTTIGGRQNSVVLQKLKPDTPYTITVSSLYPDGEGGRMTGRGKTKPLNTVKNLRVYDPSTSTLNVRWDHAEGNPRQYKLFYAPTASGPEELVPIPGNTNYAILRNLQPDTPYTVTVVPVYTEGDGGRTSDTGRT